VEYRKHSYTLCCQIAHEIEDLEPMVQIQVARWLVEQQHARLLRQRLRQRQSLQIATGKRTDGPLSEVLRVGESHRSFHDLSIGLARGAETRKVWIPPHLHELVRQKREGRRDLLGDHADDTRPVFRCVGAKRAIIELDSPGMYVRISCHSAQQRGLAGTVGTYKAEQLPPDNSEIDISQNRLGIFAVAVMKAAKRE
jgi:hypothetical protein